MSTSESYVENPAYSDAHIAAYPVEYLAGIDLYNAGEFHAAHDVWKTLMANRPPEKLFLHAMINRSRLPLWRLAPGLLAAASDGR